MCSIEVDDNAFQGLIHSIISADDLLTEILLLAPVKSLQELKFVSKRWHSLITDPSFSFKRSQKIERACGIFFANLHHIINFVPFDQGNEVGTSVPKRLNLGNVTVEINQSCNGLLCCYAGGRLMEYQNPFAYIYNPTTNRFCPIPDPPYTVSNRDSIWAMNLAFEPKRSAHYKVICVYTQPDRIDIEPEDSAKFVDTFKIGVYSSDSGQWKHAVGPFRANIYFRYGVFWNGAICWDPYPYPNNDSFYFIVDEDRLEKLLMPPSPDIDSEKTIIHFGESNGQLYLIQSNTDCVARFNIYELDEDFSGWSMKYSVDLEAVMHANPESIRNRCSPTSVYRYAFGLMCLIKDGTGSEDFILLRIWGKIIHYNIGQRTFSIVSDLAPVSSGAAGPFTEHTQTFLYIESLAQV